MTRPRGIYSILGVSALCLAVGSVFLVLDDNLGASVSVMASCLLSMTAATRLLGWPRTRADASVTRMGDEAGRPVLRPVGRGWAWFGRATVIIIATGSLLWIVDVVLDPGVAQFWRRAVVVAFALVVLIAAARAWVLAGRAHRLVPDTARSPAAAAEYRSARAFVRAGAVLTDRQRRLVAFEVAQGELMSGINSLAVAVLSSLGVSLSTLRAPLTSGTSVLALVLCSIGLVAIGVWTTALWRGRRLGDAAARIGVVPLQHER